MKMHRDGGCHKSTLALNSGDRSPPRPGCFTSGIP
jgi:hypothetical protein